jgi:hypothetical protein
MAALPRAVTTNGTVAAIIVNAFADYNAPKVSEMSAPGAAPVTFYITGDGLNPDVNENTVSDDRLGSKQVFESPGDYTLSLSVTYVWNPKVPADDKARLALLRGTSTYCAIRWAVDAETPLAAGDMFDIYPISCGFQKKTLSGRNAVHKIEQKLFVVGALAENVLLTT